MVRGRGGKGGDRGWLGVVDYHEDVLRVESGFIIYLLCCYLDLDVLVDAMENL